ncbi:MAG: VirB3 family type IV secretion system protein [Alphaproteobacteria bacterium]|nr:VirB3 family type IV secretion system protein [Alphaproteobacteria bacterium]
MKEEILKSVAAPSRLFYAPFRLFIMNAVLCVLSMLVFLVYGAGAYMWIPVVNFFVIHLILMIAAQAEPHIDNIIFLKLSFLAKTRNAVREKGDKFAP